MHPELLLTFVVYIRKKIIVNNNYSLRPIILFANTDVSRHILVVDTSVFAKSNMGRREYYTFLGQCYTFGDNVSKKNT
jgi:hypothetical protein